MNLKKYFLFSAIMSLVTLSSCSDDSISEPLKLNFSVRNLGNTSTSVDTKGVGLWISSTSLSSLKDADVVKNQKFIPTGQQLAAEGVNWTGQEKLYTYGYYPYDSNASTTPESYAVTAANHANLMWAKTETSFNGELKTPSLAFAHLMSKIVLNVKSDAKEAGALVGGEVTLKNVLTQGTANLLNGSIEANGSTSDITPASVAAASGYEGTYEAIVVPQTIASSAEFLTFETTGGVTINATLDQTLNLNAGEEAVLQVVLKEEECVVTIQEIKAWEELGAESAVAEKLLPSFNLFDLYDVDGVKGIVISLDENSDGKHGWIVSLDETECLFWTGTGRPVAIPQNANDATANLNTVLAVDPTLDAFPALKWCNDKNVNGIEGWVLPVHNTLKVFGSLVMENESTRETFNAAVKNAGGKEVNLYPDDWSDVYYFSSTCSMTGNVRCISFSSTYEYYGYTAYTPSATIGQSNLAKVRAFYHF